MMIFKSRCLAQKEASTMIGWKIKIIKHSDGFIIQCNGNKYLHTDGFVK